MVKVIIPANEYRLDDYEEGEKIGFKTFFNIVTIGAGIMVVGAIMLVCAVGVIVF